MSPRLFLRQASRTLSTSEKSFAMKHDIEIPKWHTVFARGWKNVQKVKFTDVFADDLFRVSLIENPAHPRGTALYRIIKDALEIVFEDYFPGGICQIGVPENYGLVLRYWLEVQA